MKRDKHLEEKIKAALKDLEAPLAPGSWDAFAQRLDEAPADPAEAFDGAILHRLGGLVAPPVADGWALMERMIEADETAELIENEAVMDSALYQKFDRFEAAYEPQHWPLMARRLEEEFSLRYKIYRYKIAEIALLVLFLMTVVRYAPVIGDAIQAGEGLPQPSVRQGSAPKPADLPQAPVPGTLDGAVDPNVPAAARQAQAATGSAKALPSAPPSAGPHEGEPSLVRAGSSTASNGNGPTGTDVGRRHAGASILSALPALLAQEVASLHADQGGALAEPLSTNIQTAKDPGAMASPELLSSLFTQAVRSGYAWEVPQMPQLIFERQKELRFSTFANIDASFVLTPPSQYSVFDTLIATSQDTTLASGYGGGILVSWKKHQWEFQTGGVYSFKRYIPKTPAFLFETVNYYIREDFNGVQLDLVELPFNINYHFKDEGNWRVYGMGGVSGHFVATSVYEIETKRTPSFNAIAMPSPSGLPDNNKSIRQEKNFPNGLFDGGALRDNFYMTANLGFGVERYVSPRWSVFFQPNYQHFFLSDGVGANKDKLYTFSLYLGTKVSLK